MSVLNEYFDKIYCINLDRRPDRWDKCKTLFQKFNIEVERFSAIDKNNITVNNSRITTGQLACLSSHYNVIKNSKNRGYSKILVFEDDIVFSDNFESIINSSISDVPDDWGMLYLGGNHLNGIEHIKGNVYKLISSLTTHAYAIRSSLYNNTLDRIQYADFPIDVYYAHIHREYPSYLIKDGDKQLVWQDAGYSDIDEAECNYTWLK